MPIRKGSKSLPHSGNPEAAYRDRVATNEFMQARLNDGPRRRGLERAYGRQGVDDDVRFQRRIGKADREIAQVMRRNRNAEGGSVKKFAKGGSVSKRADGIVKKGKTKGKII